MKLAVVLFGLLMVATLSMGSPFCAHCPRYDVPVCGINGITYYNRCYASCLQTPIAHTGRCNLGYGSKYWPGYNRLY